MPYGRKPMKRAELLRMKAKIEARTDKLAVLSIRKQDALCLIQQALQAPDHLTALAAVKSFKRDFSSVLKSHAKLWQSEYRRGRDVYELTYDHDLVLEAFDTLLDTARLMDKLRKKG